MEMKNISKHFSGVKALDKIQFDLRKGEIHSLLGENGAGKSTMIKILAGIHTPTEGQIFINGKEVKIEKVSDAKELGISVIHQELSLVPYMTVAENIYLGRMPSKKSGFVDDRKLEADAYKVLERLGVQDVIHVNDYPANLTVAQQQMVEIARALSVDSVRQYSFLNLFRCLRIRELQSFIFHIVWMKYSRSQTGLRCSVMDST